MFNALIFMSLSILRGGRLPGVAGLDEPEPDLPVDAVAATRDLEARHGLVHGRGLDGTSAALVLSLPAPGEDG